MPSRQTIAVLGAGVLGRRIASVFLAGGHRVHIRDPSSQALSDAAAFIDSHRDELTALTPTPHPSSGIYQTFTDIEPAVADADFVIEAVPEKLPLKVETFAEVDRCAKKPECVIASNSSSFKSSLMIEHVCKERRDRVLNVHFTMPPGIRTVELMTDGDTRNEVFEYATELLKGCGMVPVTARKESTGFIFNRLWAAVKREILFILAEGVSSAEEIDLLWANMFQQPTSLPPCRLMDQIGLDTVAFIEDNYIQERRLDGLMTVDWLRETYINQDRLGLKSEKGGLYDTAPTETIADGCPQGQDEKAQPALYLLDVGLGSNNEQISDIPSAGQILRFEPARDKMTTLVSGQSLPDGIDISRSKGRLFWTNMGRATSTHDGSVHSANIDGSDVKTLLTPGTVHTPKQLVVDDNACKVDFCDREGMSVHRCAFDGSQHEILVRTGRLDSAEHRGDMTRWCVGIAIDTVREYVYWTQKGPSKAGRGGIFRASIDLPVGQSPESRTDIELLLEGLPEPIDLELDQELQKLYWTDRGEHPLGCSLNSADLNGLSKPGGASCKKVILARHFNEPIGLKLGRQGEVYVVDLGGSVYQVTDGKKVLLWKDNKCYTGISL